MESSTKFDRLPAIGVRDLSKSFGGQRIIADVSFDIAAGEMLAVLGPSGSGKTTLLRIIAGLEQPDAGEVYLNGKLARLLPPQKRELGVVFQEHALFQRKTAEQNVAFGLEARKLTRAEIDRTVDEMLDLVNLREHRKKYPPQLSGGQRQRVALARALAFRPTAMLFDEPFSALDAVTRLELRREIRNLLREMNIPALFITHDQEEALEVADRIIVLNRGRIEQEGAPFDVYNRPRNEFVATFLGAANVLLGRWVKGKVTVGRIRLKAPPDAPLFSERQGVKIIFRPEDAALNFQPQLLDTPYVLGRAVIEDVSYIGHSERLVARLMLWAEPRALGVEAPPVARDGQRPRALSLADDSQADGFPIVIMRNKWDATDMVLETGDLVVVGLKGYRLLPHYPLRGETGAKAQQQ
ncbi:MAG TPA: ABC transporter ATP-binding protein [Blastocatellia bacterium]|jgi:ABC-type Fe3+/spermidine/putrescine transport system ATPase subunit|nr:ABC transporter ATP-binding protein [Blastocatellia bacterium]